MKTITMLAVQAFHYKTAIGDALYDGRNKPGELDLARQDVQATLRQLSRQTEQELAFLGPEEQTEGAEEGERLGQLEGGFAGIDALVDRMVQLQQAGSDDAVLQLHELVEQRFEGEIAELLAAAMADEEQEAGDDVITPALERRLEIVRRQGFEQMPSAQTASVTNLSVPIIGPLGTVMAVITCPYTQRLDKADAPDMAEALALVREAAAAISRRT